MCSHDRWIYQQLAVCVHSLWRLAHYIAFQVPAGTQPQSFSCWIWYHSCPRLVKLDQWLLAFPFCWGILSMAPAYRSSTNTSIYTIYLALNLFRLNSLPSKRYLIANPSSQSCKASVSLAENIRIVLLPVHSCLTPFVTGNGSEYSPPFWTRASIPLVELP